MVIRECTLEALRGIGRGDHSLVSTMTMTTTIDEGGVVEEMDEGVGYDDERGRRTMTRTRTTMKTIAEAAESTNEAARTAYARSVLMDHWRR